MVVLSRVLNEEFGGNMDRRILWLIDENSNQLMTYSSRFKRVMPSSVEIRSIYPFPRKEDYIETVLGNPNTGCIVVDQKLKDTGIATYFGIELANFLRSIDQKMPIYILTNFTKEKEQFVGSEWSVEEIIDKNDMGDRNKLHTLGARILRRMNVFDNMLGLREKRFADLLRKSLNEDLSEEEFTELHNLQAERTAATLASELKQLEELEKSVEVYKSVWEKFRRVQSEHEDDK
jgi:hypothetical protein